MSEVEAPKPKRKRIRIGETLNTPQNTVVRQRISTTPDRRREVSPHTSLSLKEKYERLLDNPARLSDKDKISILSRFVKYKEKQALVAGRFSELIRKYESAIKRQYVCLAAEDDVKNYCSAMPKQIQNRSGDIRLETMERLLKKVEKGELDRRKFEEIHKKYFSDIISKECLPDAQVTKMLRNMAAGKFYAPKDKDGNFDERALSLVYQEARRRKVSGKMYSPKDYDLFGVNDKGEPLSPVFNSVKGSANFRKMKNVIAEKMSEMGISPKEAYQLNAADIAHLLQPSKETVRDIPFEEVSVGIVDSPYQEFSKKLGLLLKMGGASRFSQREQEKIWLNNFASKNEKEDFQDYGDRSGLNVFLSYAERMCDKLKNDFKENDISEGFVDAWADSLCKNKSANPKLVSGFPKVPFKIDIHHWERLSAAGKDDIAADKNNADNFGVMIQYSENDVDIHAEKHRGESANFVTSDFVEQQNKFSQKHIICTSSYAVFSCCPQYFSGRLDKPEAFEKIERVLAKKESISQKMSNEQENTSAKDVMTVQRSNPMVSIPKTKEKERA